MKRKLKKVVALFVLIMAMGILFAIPTYAVSLNYSGGSSSNNTGAQGTTSGYQIRWDETNKNLVGYRFSVVSSGGTPKSGTKVINVYLVGSSDGLKALSSAQRFVAAGNVFANKKQLANGTSVSGIKAKQSNEYKSDGCGFYSSLPLAPTSVGDWIKNSNNYYLNLQRVYALCGTSLDNASESDYVLIEPIFVADLAKVTTAATPTEFAIYGAAVSGGDSYNGCNGNLTNTGSSTLWNLCNYVNREFPNALYVPSNTAVYSAVTTIKSGRYIYRDIIGKGYGCSVLTVNNYITVKYTNTVNHWAWGFGGNGNNWNKEAFHLKDTTYTKNKNDKFKLTKDNAITPPNGFYVENDFGSSYMTGSWANYPFGTEITQKASAMSAEYDYQPINYSITYDLDGGINNSNNPSTYNVLYGKNLYPPTKNGCEFKGWLREVTNSNISLSAADYNYNYYNVLYGIQPGTKYDISIDKATLTAGSSAKFTSIIYDFTDSRLLVRATLSFGSNLTYSLTCPATANATHDLRILIYSGVDGGTKGVATNYSNVKICFLTDGINKGCGSAFSSADQLFTELTKRTTGNITLKAIWEVREKIAILQINPNAGYREKTNVISSFWLINITDHDFVPSTEGKVVFSVYTSDGKKIAEETQAFVVPKNDKNLAYFTWYVPDGYASDTVTVKAHIVDNGLEYGHVEDSYSVIPYSICKTPNTSYEAKAPEGFTIPNTIFDNEAKARWWQWEYSNGSFVKKEYAVSNKADNVMITVPKSPSAYFEGGKLHLKSGYGFGCSFIPSMLTVDGYEFGSADKCVVPQYFYALFPEYNYEYGIDKCRSFETVSGKKEFVNSPEMLRQHFTPIYYPDGEYNLQIVLSDCWTPSGMLMSYKTVTIQIYGNIFDDWYISDFYS